MASGRVLLRPEALAAEVGAHVVGVGVELGGPFDRGRGGPGDWWIMDATELHFPDPTSPGEEDALVPDLAGWRRERLPALPDVAAFTLTPGG